MKPSNVRKKKRKTTKYDKRTVKCDVGTASYEDETIKCEEKKKGTIECDKKIVKCDVEIRGVHQTAKTTPKSPVKWHNHTVLQITVHRTA